MSLLSVTQKDNNKNDKYAYAWSLWVHVCVCMLMIKDNVVQHNMFTISFYLMCRCYSDTMHEYHIHNINT